MLKEQFTTEPILIMFNFTKSIMLKIDTLDLTFGTRINQQKFDKKWYLVAFYLRKLIVSE